MSVQRTELLEADPLPPLRGMRRRLLITFPIVVLFAVIGIFFTTGGWSMAWFGLALWLLYAGWLWFDDRAFMQADGRELKVRNHFKLHHIDATQVVGVRHQFNGKRPDFTLQLADGKSVWVPASRLQRGHSTLFAWLGWFAPDATLDRKSRVYRDHLVDKKLI